MDGSSTITVNRQFGGNPGRLEMLSYCPATKGSSAPLIVVLHGCGQGAEEYAACAGWLALADRLGCAVLAPQQTTANNPTRCFNWFSPQDVNRGAGEVASIAEMIAFMIRTHDLDPARVFITGLSAGGAMTVAMLATYPELFAGGAVIAGLPYGVAHDIMQAMTAMHQVDQWSALNLGRLLPANAGSYPRLSVWHGESDHVVAPGNAKGIVAQWALAQGLSSEPTQTTVVGTRTRSAWRGNGGEVAIELNFVRGLSHGVPLSTLGDQGLGRIAPYMLEAGLCSSTEIAKFWNLLPASATPLAESPERGRSPSITSVGPAHPAEEDKRLPPRGAGNSVGDHVLASLSPRVSSGVQDVIAKALRSAGLVG